MGIVSNPDAGLNESAMGSGGLSEAQVDARVERSINVRPAIAEALVPPTVASGQGIAAGTGALSSGQSAIAIGAGSIASGSYSTALGSTAYAYEGIAIGKSAKTYSERQISIGYTAGYPSYSPDSICIGYATSAKSQGIALGSGAYVDNTGSIALGHNSYVVHSDSVVIGKYASTGSGNGGNTVLIGANTYSNYPNTTVLGANATVTGSNQVQLGDSSTTAYCYGVMQNRSDKRDKANVRDCTLGLEFINRLRTVEYVWDYRDDYARTLFIFPEKPEMPEVENATEEGRVASLLAYHEQMEVWQNDCGQINAQRAAWMANPVKDGSKKRIRFHSGLIAQEVKAVLDDMDIDWGGYQNHAINGGNDVQSIGYIELIAPMLKAIQQLSAKVQQLEQERN